jgi:hypothetical protein
MKNRCSLAAVAVLGGAKPDARGVRGMAVLMLSVASDPADRSPLSGCWWQVRTPP